jgi:hypothetical protein
MISKLLALPTFETAQYLRDLFQGAPMLIDPDGFGVQIGSSRELIEPVEGVVYAAVPGLMKAYYETATSRSYWLLPLFPSPEMAARHDEIGDAWDREFFVPFLVIAEVQNMRHNHVSFMNSIASSLASTHPILTFHNELVITDESITPDHQDFYDDWIHKGMVNNEYFLAVQDTQD